MTEITEKSTEKSTGVFFPYLLISLLSRVVLGGILLFAGIVKLPHFDSFVWEIEQYRILPEILVSSYAHILPVIEILLGVMIIAGIFIRANAALSGLLVLSFTIAKTSALMRGLDIEVCPCFGPGMPLFLMPSIFIDVVMLAAAGYLFWQKKRCYSVLDLLSIRKKAAMQNSSE